MEKDIQESVKIFLEKLKLMRIDTSGYELSKDLTELIKYNGNDKDVKIPPVKRIGDQCFSGTSKDNLGFIKVGHSSVRKLIIPDSVEEIGRSAFSHMVLDEFVLGNQVREVDEFAFYKANIKCDIVIPASIKSIKKQSFAVGKFNNVKLENGIKQVDEGAFGFSSINELTIPASIVNIGYNSFQYLEVNRVIIEDGVKRIDDSAFSNAKIEQYIKLPNSLESIGLNCFYQCTFGRQVLRIPYTVKNIEAHAFESCLGLKVVEVPETANIEERAFGDNIKVNLYRQE